MEHIITQRLNEVLSAELDARMQKLYLNYAKNWELIHDMRDADYGLYEALCATRKKHTLHDWQAIHERLTAGKPTPADTALLKSRGMECVDGVLRLPHRRESRFKLQCARTRLDIAIIEADQFEDGDTPLTDQDFEPVISRLPYPIYHAIKKFMPVSVYDYLY